MYEDLRKYITKEELLKRTEAWYIKRLCECSKDEKYVTEFIENLVENGNQIDTDFGPFECMLEFAYHWEDIFNEEYPILKLILSCFLDKFEIHTSSTDPFDIFLDHTTRGRKIIGLTHSNPIVNVFDHWEEFISLFEELSDEDIKENYNNPVFRDEVCEDLYFNHIALNFDELEETAELDMVLDELCFCKVKPGQYVYASMNFSGEFSGYDTLGKSTLEYIDSQIDKKRDLLEFDRMFSYFVVDLNPYFYDLFELKGSNREVIF